MKEIAVKSHYGAAELAAMGLPSIPGTMQGVKLRAKSAAWAFRKRAGRGGGLEYAIDSLPTEAQDEIRRRATTALIVAPAPAKPAAVTRHEQQLQLVETDAQRLRADARKGILATLDRIMVQCHVSREAAMTTLLTQARMGTLDDHLVMMLRAARDERGRKGDGFPSIRTLKRYLGLSKSGSLAPKVVRQDFSVPEWARVFLGFYQQPQKPSVELAYREFEKAYRMRDREWDFPTVHQVRRFLGKLGKVSREVGRMGPRELKNIRPFVRRTFEQLQPNDVWTADGHTFDAEVQHPLHGRPFRPEITTIIDIATRMAVGFSVGLAESSLAVLEAISHAAIGHGAPAIFYVDNGSGYSNQLLKREGTGLKGLLGFEVSHSLPYNSQAKGVIERSHQTIWIQGAKLLPSFIGAAMDREARLTQYKITRTAVRKGGVLPLMSWEHFVQFATERIDEYNRRPHRSLPKADDAATAQRRHMSPLECLEAFRSRGWEPTTLTASEAQSVFRPRVERTVLRGEISLFNNRYFSGLLEEFHGEPVQVAFDIHDAQRVWVHDKEGRFICSAEFGANERHYFPTSYVEQAREKRADAREKRLDAHRDEIEAERRGRRALTMETPEVLDIPGIGRISREALNARVVDVPAVEAVPVTVDVATPTMPMATVIDMPESAAQRFARWQALDKHITDGGTIEKTEDLKWYGLYAQSKEFAAQKRRAEEAGELPLANQM
ncbi:Mu transposase C-terminal domain-containing protein [Burkholderia vietnamiensis]|uniref:Mu transposase C-terminal domain-containing protein n=1 Tax=Burkholderia vietnamiensis TaxID=60552 RepID=UPI001CF3DBDA|nr:Mu transposase C-terminal domain-containing protein [Burkholderia vietnamiensis]MCA8194133.1 Mu transposase C-terminal domain-containing protein [Burkholderia vietnamiensis]